MTMELELAILSDCHVHLYLRVWFIAMNNKVFKLEVVNAVHFTCDFQRWERSRFPLQLK